ncbi:RNA binding domain protein [Cordyceps fumosorosea ARSEF 2679]|uniref:RNA binding domain protein n=1 Tax=Cordyceps fumosorosea (strain ARSEF 2679) TaxID=1081104 RepID=A0A167MYE7_CORFA|nr:RNA binding domain protein [Cordyceps fumosorosea ARSEF 2679]OAA54903.1 RNA binding domain protein [Cordyceps fumosorosea ARSEF 2679]
MNQIRAIQALNKKEIENGVSPEASWHTDYRDTAYIYFGGLPYELSEGDVITIFSQFGEPVFLKLVRDKETGKSKGFGWLKYENQRSTDLAVDNLGGAEVGGRLLRVDHARYTMRDDEDQDEFKVGWEDLQRKQGRAVSEDESSEDEAPQRPMLQEERDLAKLIHEHDDDDPMKAFLIEEKKKEVEEAREKADRKEAKHKHRSHRSHRSRHGDDDKRRSRRGEEHSERRHRHQSDYNSDGRRDDDRRRDDDDEHQTAAEAEESAIENETQTIGTGGTQARIESQRGTTNDEGGVVPQDGVKHEE